MLWSEEGGLELEIMAQQYKVCLEDPNENLGWAQL